MTFRAGNVYVTDSEDSLEIMDLLSENEVFINNNDLKESLMSNIQDIKGVKIVKHISRTAGPDPHELLQR